MLDFILKGILWVLALYGLAEIIKTIIYTYTYTGLKADGIYLVVATKNQEKKIEGFIRSFLFKLIYNKEDNLKDVIIVDLNSTDETKEIISKIGNDYDNVKISNWKDCKDLFDRIDDIA